MTEYSKFNPEKLEIAAENARMAYFTLKNPLQASEAAWIFMQINMERNRRLNAEMQDSPRGA